MLLHSHWNLFGVPLGGLVQMKVSYTFRRLNGKTIYITVLRGLARAELTLMFVC